MGRPSSPGSSFGCPCGPEPEHETVTVYMCACLCTYMMAPPSRASHTQQNPTCSTVGDNQSTSASTREGRATGEHGAGQAGRTLRITLSRSSSLSTSSPSKVLRSSPGLRTWAGSEGWAQPPQVTADRVEGEVRHREAGLSPAFHEGVEEQESCTSARLPRTQCTTIQYEVQGM